MSFFAFLRSIFSESDGSGSWARLGSAASLIAGIYWVTKVVLATHGLPDFTSLTLFITGLYGVNKLHDGLTSVFGKTNG